MPVKLDYIADELRSLKPSLPLGIEIKVDYVNDVIMVANKDVGFCITRMSIDDNVYVDVFEHGLKGLIEVVSDPALVAAVSKTSNLIDVNLVRTKRLVDDIFDIRVRNNLPWKRLMEIALKHAPEETKAVLREINENDRKVSDLLAELAK